MLSIMASKFFAGSQALGFPVLALGLFSAVFCAVCIRTLLMDKGQLSSLAQLPLDHEED